MDGGGWRGVTGKDGWYVGRMQRGGELGGGWGWGHYWKIKLEIPKNYP